ncbi:hypothetical protein LCGC14_0503600 [marine sediment metagenome]|uniref:Uncharacterized protein n=1 Tax=marine sediment metagenome TaxID=412755 RepID=A0A0F9SLJ3_9ZZZZ
MKIIELGDPQPMDCPSCGDKMGYKHSDYMKVHYETFYNSDGSEGGGSYSDFIRILNLGVIAICCECNARLPFKLNRSGE